MPAPEPFAYCVLQVVPCVERGERVNAGVVLFSRRLRFLAARTALRADVLRALAPELDLDALALRLRAAELLAAGDEAAGPLARLEPSERFGVLAATSSTVLQASPVHTGLCPDAAGMLDHLFTRLVA